MAPRIACAQTVLTEADVVRLARSESPVSRVANATDALASAREQTAGLYPNPSIGWQREAITSTPSATEDVIRATIPLELGRPPAVRSLAKSKSAWLRVEASLARTDAVLEALLAYYDMALAQRRVNLRAQAVDNLAEAARVLARREAAGSASGYESARLAIASQLSQSQHAQAQGEYESARTRLGALLGLDARTLRINTPLALAPLDLERQRRGKRHAVQQARAAQRLAADAESLGNLAWLPSLELEAGLKHVTDAGSSYGYVVGLSVGLPIFDHGQAIRSEAEAQRTLSAARSDALVRSIDVEQRSSQKLYLAARQELERFQAETKDLVATLLRAAQSGYREGERSIVELLDAQRAQTEVSERGLALLARAKRAEARLRAATGEL